LEYILLSDVLITAVLCVPVIIFTIFEPNYRCLLSSHWHWWEQYASGCCVIPHIFSGRTSLV